MMNSFENPIWETEAGEKYLSYFSSLPAHKFAVIKVGGEMIDNAQQLDLLSEGFAALYNLGLYPTVVHGGGPQITRGLKAAGIDTKAVNGIRTTPSEAVSLIPGLLGEVNTKFVKAITDRGAAASGITGGIFQGKLEDTQNFGSVTDVTTESKPIETCISQKVIPVISCAGTLALSQCFELQSMRRKETAININADLAAVAMAAALKPEKYISLTKPGAVLDRHLNPFDELTPAMAEQYIDDGVINGGMDVKVKEAIKLLNLGVHDIVITNPAALLKELFTNEGSGTIIRK